IIEPVGVRHRAEVTGVLADFLVISMQITEDRFELTNDLAIERHIHPKHAVRGWMLRSHRNFEQFALEARSHRYRWPLHCFECLNARVHRRFIRRFRRFSQIPTETSTQPEIDLCKSAKSVDITS